MTVTHTRTILVAYAIYSSVLGLLYANLPPNPDQSIFNYIGWVWIGGGVPYADAADVNFFALQRTREPDRSFARHAHDLGDPGDEP